MSDYDNSVTDRQPEMPEGAPVQDPDQGMAPMAPPPPEVNGAGYRIIGGVTPQVAPQVPYGMGFIAEANRYSEGQVPQAPVAMQDDSGPAARPRSSKSDAPDNSGTATHRANVLKAETTGEDSAGLQTFATEADARR